MTKRQRESADFAQRVIDTGTKKEAIQLAKEFLKIYNSQVTLKQQLQALHTKINFLLDDLI